MSFDAIPKDLRGLRACLVCSLVKVSVQNKERTTYTFYFCRSFFYIDFRSIWEWWLRELWGILADEGEQGQRLRSH